MTKTITSAEMQSLEKAAIASGRVTGLSLMERAGQGVVDAIFKEWPDLGSAQAAGSALQKTGMQSPFAVVLCGPGNNGGDGFVVARLLHHRGWRVEAVLFGDLDKLPPDAKTNALRCGIPITQMSFDQLTRFDRGMAAAAKPDLLIDALFGIGLNRPIRGFAQLLAAIQRDLQHTSLRTVAIDVPSGLNADTGERLCDVIPTDLTVSFHLAKPGHMVGQGPQTCGALTVVDIGL